MYKYLLVIVDGFSKFVWFYSIKITNTKELLDKLTAMQQIFGNSRRIITVRIWRSPLSISAITVPPKVKQIA